MSSALLAVISNTIPSGHTLDVTITTPGLGTYSPPDWLIGQTITIQCWGAGADGTTDGGGGGEFAQGNWLVTGDALYGVDAGGGADVTYFDGGTLVQAFSAIGQSGGTAGTGDVTYDGGDGGSSLGPRAGGGAGCGGDLGAGSSGGNANGFAPGSGGASGNTDPDSGKGGDGGGNGQNGQNGTQPGGGGGGSVTDTPGAGGNGQIRILYPAL